MQKRRKTCFSKRRNYYTLLSLLLSPLDPSTLSVSSKAPESLYVPIRGFESCRDGSEQGDGLKFTELESLSETLYFRLR